jgi:hypothetical protein
MRSLFSQSPVKSVVRENQSYEVNQDVFSSRHTHDSLINDLVGKLLLVKDREITQYNQSSMLCVRCTILENLGKASEIGIFQDQLLK